MTDNAACKNTDREIYRTPPGMYDDSIHVTEGGGIGINVGGHVIVKSLRDWHALATPSRPVREDPTCYIERSAVRQIILAQPDEPAYGLLWKVDELPISVAADFASAVSPQQRSTTGE